jgi:hypothetical protein
MLAHLWTALAFDSGMPGWGAWLRRLERHDALPRRIDPLHLARTRTGQEPASQVHIVLDPEALPSLVGVRRLPPYPGELAAEAPDLARRIGYVMGLLVPDDRRRALMQRTLRPWLAEAPGQPVVVPDEYFHWLNGEASRLADGLSRAGYAVHGDLADLAPARRAGVEAPEPRATLALAVRMMLAGPSGAAVAEEES